MLTLCVLLGELTACPGSHDGLHPNALGEYEIASAFSKVMNEHYDIGSAEFTIPSEIPPRPCAHPVHLRAEMATKPEDNSRYINVTWKGQYGAFGYRLQTRRKGWDWGQSVGIDALHYEMGAPPSEEWEVRVQTYCGDDQDLSDWSQVASVTT